jgi:molecular chaperone DnaK (HSP70)
MRVDTNGILSVYAKVDQTGQELEVTVTSNKGRMSEQELEAKRQENAAYEAQCS